MPIITMCVYGTLEALLINLLLFNHLYIPPNLPMFLILYLATHITNLCDKNLPIIILGDFHTPDINWDTLTGSSKIYSVIWFFI